MQPNTQGQLKICNAKTKQGTLCQNIGNAKNGRCHLHGGNSTGPKTKEGKHKSSKNAQVDFPAWMEYRITSKDIALVTEAINAAAELIKIVTKERAMSQEDLHQFIGNHRIAFEVMKYEVLNKCGSDVFILVQSALDYYYQDENAKHTEFHIFYALFSSPYFPRYRTKAQDNYLKKLFDKSISKSWQKMNKEEIDTKEQHPFDFEFKGVF